MLEPLLSVDNSRFPLLPVYNYFSLILSGCFYKSAGNREKYSAWNKTLTRPVVESTQRNGCSTPLLCSMEKTALPLARIIVKQTKMENGGLSVNSGLVMSLVLHYERY